jgi:hypothetical protein
MPLKENDVVNFKREYVVGCNADCIRVPILIIPKGTQGTIVAVYEADRIRPGAYEVEVEKGECVTVIGDYLEEVV